MKEAIQVAGADLSRAQWRKSSRSGDGHENNCVEVASLGAVTAVRDSKNPTGPALLFPHPTWRAFLTTTRTGTFDPSGQPR